MQTTLKAVLAAAAAVASMAASAQHFSRVDLPQVDARQARQEQRIERGLARGDFTRREVRELQQDQREIARAEARAKADGHVSRDEIRHLARLLDQADERIRQLRHNRDSRRPA